MHSPGTPREDNPPTRKRPVQIGGSGGRDFWGKCVARTSTLSSHFSHLKNKRGENIFAPKKMKRRKKIKKKKKKTTRNRTQAQRPRSGVLSSTVARVVKVLKSMTDELGLLKVKHCGIEFPLLPCVGRPHTQLRP